MNDHDLKDQLAGLFSGLEDDPAADTGPDGSLPPLLPVEPVQNEPPPAPPRRGVAQAANVAPSPPVATAAPRLTAAPVAYPRPGVNWRLIIWSVLGTLAAIMLVAYGQALFWGTPDEEPAEQLPGFVIPLTPPRRPPPRLRPRFDAAPLPSWSLRLSPRLCRAGG